ncbi:MAG: flagellar biosynthetic protein FliO [Rhodospirillaceae bacterium]|nr:flagellar biosynthetic protein FliO [Rhodospirillaceae bacterium]
MEAQNYITAVLVLILVIGLILGLAALLKRFGLTDARVLGRRARLATVESKSLDGRHRLVLVRRDDVEHLLLIGPNTSQVLERGIPASAVPEDESSAASAFGRLLTGKRDGDAQP